MTKYIVFACICLLSASSMDAQTSASKKKTKSAPVQAAVPAELPPLTLSNFRDSMSYALAVNVITTIQRQKLEINPMILLRALEDQFMNKQPLLTESDMSAIFTKYEMEKAKNSPKENSGNMEETKAKCNTFLAENAKKPGVQTTPSGLQYRVITQGSGAKPLASDKVKVHYKGTLIDGKEFDSSYKRGEPIEFPLNGVIKGWTEGLQLMPVGSKYEFTIPSDLAYGDREVGGGLIPAGSTLVFEVELLAIPSQSTTPSSDK